MAISGDGDVFVWNLGTMTLTAKSSLGPLFRSVACTGGPPPRPSAATARIPGSSGGAGVAGAAGGEDGAGAATASAGGGGKVLPGVSVARAGVTAQGMPLVMLACPGAFGGSLQAFALHETLGTWVRVADGRCVFRFFFSAFGGGCLGALLCRYVHIF